MRRLIFCAALIAAMLPALAQEIPLEYQVKAAYLYNFTKFVEWPAAARDGTLNICVAGRDPFGSVLADTIRDEVVNGRPLAARVILEPEPGCHVLFIPQGANVGAYLRAARGTPTLTVGETADFLDQGGIIAFTTDEHNVRFAISSEAAEQAGLQLSSRLLRLAVHAPRGNR